MKSKFLFQDVDVVFLADKGTMTKFSWRRESSVTTSGSLKMDSLTWITVSGVDRMFESSASPFKHITDRLNPLRK